MEIERGKGSIEMCLVGERRKKESNSLKAAGTPMMRPGPLASSVARFTLLPGFPSTSSTLGIESPTLTMIAT